MNRTWLTGTALAALMAATPALAQDTSPCDLTGPAVTDTTIAALDNDGDGEISRDEYLRCLDANVSEADRQAFLDEFDAMGDDGVIVIADLDMGGDTAVAAGEGTATEVAVKQPEAEVKVDQAAPTVQVDQANPTVEVEQPEPQVAVTQQEPKVNVSQPQPEVSVTQPEPTVEVQQGEAQVAVDQPEPQVSIDAPAPEVEVSQAKPNVTVEQHEPKVSVSQPDPEVSVETAEANVEVESEEPKVVINQGEPEIKIEKVSEADATVEQADATATDATSTDTAMTERDPSETPAASGTETQMAQADSATSAPTPATTADATAEQTAPAINFAELEGRTVLNSAGEKIGDVDEVVIENATKDMYVVVSVGGFLGIGDKDVVFPMSDVSMDGDDVVLKTTQSKDDLKAQGEYDESLYTELED